MDAGFFDVLHNAGDDHVLAVGERVDIDLGGFFQKMIDENGALLGVLDGFFHVARNRFIVVGDDHGASAEHVRGADQHGISDTISGLQSLFDASGDAARRLRDLEFIEEFAKTFAVFGQVDRFRRSTDDGHTGSF